MGLEERHRREFEYLLKMLIEYSKYSELPVDVVGGLVVDEIRAFRQRIEREEEELEHAEHLAK